MTFCLRKSILAASPWTSITLRGSACSVGSSCDPPICYPLWKLHSHLIQMYYNIVTNYHLHYLPVSLLYYHHLHYLPVSLLYYHHLCCMQSTSDSNLSNELHDAFGVRMGTAGETSGTHSHTEKQQLLT